MKIDPKSEAYKKVNRLLHPKDVSDYGLCASEVEMRQHPEGRQMLADYKRMKRIDSRAAAFASALGENASRRLDELRMKVIKGVKSC